MAKREAKKREQQKKIDFAAIEKKWQKEWEKKKIFEVREESKKRKFYVLEMFPYPSASGLHVGHAFNYIIGDIFARFKRMNGFYVLHPMGYDSLGLPAENAAVKEGRHPKDYTDSSIKNFIRQQKALGLSYDWSRMVNTSDSSYYKWDQWIFLKMFERGLAYRKKSAVNWCPKCKTVLANEQVVSGNCWRHEDTPVEIKHLEQWYFKITDYVEELNDFSKLGGWPELIKKLQQNWIGKSHGTEIDFEINGEKWPIFTTRPDTIYGVTFMVISAQHPRLMELVTQENKKKVEGFLKRIGGVSEKELEEMNKEGVFTGSYAVNPLTKEKIPVYAGNFVVADYGCGMVMAVPCHDQRDFEFAKKYKIPIKVVIAPNFILSGKNAPKEDIGALERRTVTAIIEHPKEDKFLLLKEPDNLILIGGGMEKNETPEEAITRELKEETGYANFEIKKLLFNHLFCLGYRYSKNKNQKTDDVIFYIKLKNDKKLKSGADEGKHEVLWLNRKDILDKLTWEHHKFIWNTFEKGESAYTEEGILVNSSKFSGMENRKALEEITKYLESKKLGRKTINYKLRDWLISRQRYWGTPIPVVYCDKCGIVPVPENKLPVELPKNVKFGKGNPLATSKEFINAKCPRCSGKARRETDTMDTFVNSSWYQLRYCDSKNNKKIFDAKKTAYWNPVDLYTGGKEHACMHLIYIRFYTKFLRDLGLLNFDEPAVKLFNQGYIYGEDGRKMSKSFGNVIDPLDTAKKYGIDGLRVYVVSVASADSNYNWSDAGIQGSFRFVNKVANSLSSIKFGKSSKLIESKFNKSIKEVTENLENMKYNLAVIKLRELFDKITEIEISKEDYCKFLKLFCVFAPHITEELWHKLGNKTFISLEKWPKADESKINPALEKQEEQKDRLISDIKNIMKILEAKNELSRKKVVKIFAIPNELGLYKEAEKKISEIFGLKAEVLNIKDAGKTGKIIKASHGRPAIYLE